MTSTETDTGRERERKKQRHQFDKWKRLMLDEKGEIEKANSEAQKKKKPLEC